MPRSVPALLARARKGALEAHYPSNQGVVPGVRGRTMTHGQQLVQPHLGVWKGPRHAKAQRLQPRRGDRDQQGVLGFGTLREIPQPLHNQLPPWQIGMRHEGESTRRRNGREDRWVTAGLLARARRTRPARRAPTGTKPRPALSSLPRTWRRYNVTWELTVPRQARALDRLKTGTPVFLPAALPLSTLLQESVVAPSPRRRPVRRHHRVSAGVRRPPPVRALEAVVPAGHVLENEPAYREGRKLGIDEAVILAMKEGG